MPPRRRLALKDKLPEALKACLDGWTIDQSIQRKPCELKTEDDFLDEYTAQSLKATYRNLATSMSARLRSLGLEVSSVNSYKQLLSEIAIHLVLDPTLASSAGYWLELLCFCYFEGRRWRRFNCSNSCCENSSWKERVAFSGATSNRTEAFGLDFYVSILESRILNSHRLSIVG